MKTYRSLFFILPLFVTTIAQAADFKLHTNMSIKDTLKVENNKNLVIHTDSTAGMTLPIVPHIDSVSMENRTKGTMVFNKTTKSVWYHNGTTFVDLSADLGTDALDIGLWTVDANPTLNSSNVTNFSSNLTVVAQPTTNITYNNDGTWTLQPGRYKLEASFSSSPGKAIEYYFYDTNILGTKGVNSNGSNHYLSSHALAYLDVTSTQNIHIRGISYSGATVLAGSRSWISIQQLPETSAQVIKSTDTQVDDQTTNGYMDIGNMRMQWGKTTICGSRIYFEVNFKNTLYVLTASATGGYWNRNVGINAQYTDSFTATCNDPGSSNSVSLPFNWIAIGEKP